MAIFEKIKANYFLILVCILSVYAPLMGQRVIRMAGDEKVYVAQAHEMAQSGFWFKQTLFDSPDYYKGPAHFLLTRLGFHLFGDSPWAILYMNFLLLLVASYCFWKLLRRLWPEEEGIGFLGATLLALNIGCFSHALVSQMEIELVAGFTAALFFLSQTDRRSRYVFWVIAGVVGWFKSPLHSAFLGCTGILYPWFLGEGKKVFRDRHYWFAMAIGILVGFLGYLPTAMVDFENFNRFYIQKETVAKSTSGQPWTVAIFSTFGFYLFPWALLMLISSLRNIFHFRDLWSHSLGRKVLSLCFALALPSVVFFIYHPYRFENYNLPVISSAILWMSLGMVGAMSGWLKGIRFSAFLTAFLYLVVGLGLFMVHKNFSESPNVGWWNWVGIPTLILMSLSAIIVFMGLVKNGRFLFLSLGLSMIPFYWGVSLWITMIGEREMIDLRAYLIDKSEAGLMYYNMDRNIWSEWALLQHWIRKPVGSIHNEKLLAKAWAHGETILVPGEEAMADLRQRALTAQVDLEVRPWKRWRTRPGGLEEAWKKQDLSLLERDFYIVLARPKSR